MILDFKMISESGRGRRTGHAGTRRLSGHAVPQTLGTLGQTGKVPVGSGRRAFRVTGGTGTPPRATGAAASVIRRSLRYSPPAIASRTDVTDRIEVVTFVQVGYNSNLYRYNSKLDCARLSRTGRPRRPPRPHAA